MAGVGCVRNDLHRSDKDADIKEKGCKALFLFLGGFLVPRCVDCFSLFFGLGFGRINLASLAPLVASSDFSYRHNFVVLLVISTKIAKNFLAATSMSNGEKVK